MKHQTPKESDVAHDAKAENLQDLQHEELSGTEDDDTASLDQSDTDEDENEGVGDGNMGGRKRVKS